MNHDVPSFGSYPLRKQLDKRRKKQKGTPHFFIYVNTPRPERSIYVVPIRAVLGATVTSCPYR